MSRHEILADIYCLGEMRINIPECSLVVLIGPSGAGKSTFARQHFLPTETISSDHCRALVSDNENNQAATPDAFDVLHFIAAKRLAAGRLTVIDATSVKPEDRKPLVSLARQYHCLTVAIVFDLPLSILRARSEQRTDRYVHLNVIQRQADHLHRSMGGLRREGFNYVYVLSSPEEVETVTIKRRRLWCNRKYEHGPFDIIGDVHGCFDELVALLKMLGYTVSPQPDGASDQKWRVHPPEGRKAIFLGDLVDRGPNSPAVLRLIMSMVAGGTALCVSGNHDVRLARALKGQPVQISHGLAETLEQLQDEPPAFRGQVVRFLDRLVSHYVLDRGRLVVAHAGMKKELQGRVSRWVRRFALYGDTPGESDEFGSPVRFEWVEHYRGRATVVYGHRPVVQPQWIHNTINVDTGCAFGGRLTALRYPEKQLVSVPAYRTYYEPVRSSPIPR